jgi:hypothetical protein
MNRGFINNGSQSLRSPSASACVPPAFAPAAVSWPLVCVAPRPRGRWTRSHLKLNCLLAAAAAAAQAATTVAHAHRKQAVGPKDAPQLSSLLQFPPLLAARRCCSVGDHVADVKTILTFEILTEFRAIEGRARRPAVFALRQSTETQVEVTKKR